MEEKKEGGTKPSVDKVGEVKLVLLPALFYSMIVRKKSQQDQNSINLRSMQDRAGKQNRNTAQKKQALRLNINKGTCRNKSECHCMEGQKKSVKTFTEF